ncbi:ATP-binding protein [Candidatus Nitrospira neomarina]|uniref:histidine kinase n=1 Tax=Candidatus Nitrospira neomarina TaxID=3020899 RepID=A0AA96JZS2_9BACT|nr:ATP-binding protein [Candidatus Nitrospira neomarina]WNM61396.1 ATP-binding protein [Candidatus Nitrospira neomarina]
MKPPKRAWLGTGSIGRALLILSTMFILALFGILLYTITTIQNQKLDSVMVDLAGQQRMLSQRLMNEILLISQGIPADYRFTQKILNQNLDALLVGGQAMINQESGDTAVLPPPPSQEIRQALGEQQSLLGEFIQRGDTFLKTRSDLPGYSLELDGLLALNARLIDVANMAVKLYSRNSQEKISNMIVWESLIGTLVIIFGILITRKVKLANQELEHEIQERSRIETALRYRIEIENLMTNLSTQFISLEAKDLDAEINRALEAIGTFGGVDRSYVFIFEDDGTTMNNTHEWCQAGIEPQLSRLQGLRMQEIPWFAKRLISGPFFQISSVANLPLEASAEKQEFQKQQIQSLVIVPMVLRGKLFGFLGFDSVQHEKTWSEEDIRLLQMAGEIFVNGFERQQVEENLRKSEAAKVEAFRQSDALKTALLSLVSHELRTPLTAIKASIAGLIELSKQDASKVQQEFLQSINQEIDFLNGLVDNLLDMSKVEAGTLVPHREWHLLEDLVEGAIRRLEMSLKSRSLQVNLGEKISPIFVDGMEIQQVLINLLDNAIKYSSPGSLVSIVGRMTPNQVEVRVSSEGEGIPQEELVSIFNRFYRLKGPRTRLIRGTGLGLAICKGMVEAHGGRIWAESRNRIVTISFTLPIPDAPPMINFDREEE